MARFDAWMWPDRRRQSRADDHGWIVTLGNEEKVYTFHVASKEQGDPDEHLKEDIIANCTDVENRVQPTINPGSRTAFARSAARSPVPRSRWR